MNDQDNYYGDSVIKKYTEYDMKRAFDAGKRAEVLKYNSDALWVKFKDWIDHFNEKKLRSTHGY